MRIRDKLILTFILTISLQFVMLLTILNSHSTQTIIEKQGRIAVANLNIVSGLTEGVMRQAEFQLLSFVGDNELNKTFRRFERKSSYIDDEDALTILQKISQFNTSNQFVDGGYVYLYKPQVIIPPDSFPIIVAEVKDPSLYEWITVPFIEGRNTSEWTLTHRSPPANFGTILIYKMKIIDQSNREVIGEGGVYLMVSNLKNSLLEYGIGRSNRNFYIINQDGTILLSQTLEEVNSNIGDLHAIEYQAGSGWYEQTINGEKCLVTYTAIEHANWSILEMIPFDEFSMSFLEQLPFAIWSIVFLSITTVIVVFVLFSMNMYKPVNTLVASMEKVMEGDLSVRIDNKRKDEFALLIGGFNEMVDRINHLIEELSMQKVLTKEAEIRTLRSQINPHFLYNTMDALHWMARLGETDQVAKLTLAVSRFYQLSLNKGSDVTTVEDAVELVWQYLNIQKARIGDKLDIDIQADESLMEKELPHFVIQPLLENAVLHGIGKIPGKGTIVVRFTDWKDHMRITIEDNGGGIDDSSLERINRIIKSDKQSPDGSCFALWNINKQLNLRFGPGDWLRIESSPNQGTRIVVIVPLKTNGKET